MTERFNNPTHLKTFCAILLMLCCATLANTALRSSLKPRADARATPYPTWSLSEDIIKKKKIFKDFPLKLFLQCELTSAAVTVVVTAAWEVVGSRWRTPVEFSLSIA